MTKSLLNVSGERMICGEYIAWSVERVKIVSPCDVTPCKCIAIHFAMSSAEEAMDPAASAGVSL